MCAACKGKRASIGWLGGCCLQDEVLSLSFISYCLLLSASRVRVEQCEDVAQWPVRPVLLLAACAVASALSPPQPGCDCTAPALCKADAQPPRKEVWAHPGTRKIAHQHATAESS